VGAPKHGLLLCERVVVECSVSRQFYLAKFAEKNIMQHDKRGEKLKTGIVVIVKQEFFCLRVIKEGRKEGEAKMSSNVGVTRKERGDFGKVE